MCQTESTTVRHWAHQAASVLDQFPLALELGGILVREGIVSLNSSPSVFSEKYADLSKFPVDPGDWTWNRAVSMSAMFDALYKLLQEKNPSACLILTVCSIYGPWQTPVPMLRQLGPILADLANDKGPWKPSRAVFEHDTDFNRAIYDLCRVFTGKRKQDSLGEVQSISLHASVCRWKFATIMDDKAAWIMHGSYALANYIHSCQSM